jgi:antitoxin Phd
MALCRAQEAKARFSELLETVGRDGPQTVTKGGVETAILVPIDLWRWLRAQTRPTLKDWLLDPKARVNDLDKFIPLRRSLKIKASPRRV